MELTSVLSTTILVTALAVIVFAALSSVASRFHEPKVPKRSVEDSEPQFFKRYHHQTP